MEFSEVLQRLEVESGRGRGHVPADWLLRELQVAFIGPVAAQAECRLSSGGALATVVIGTYGAPRPSSLAWPMPAARATADDPDRAVPLPLLPGITPAFAEHIEMRWAEGALPFGGGVEPRCRVLLRHREAVPVGEAQLIALADAMPPVGLALLTKPAPVSSLTLTLEFLGREYDAAPGRWWCVEAAVTAGGEGYLHQTATLFDPTGRPIALNRQVVVVYDAR